MYDKIHTIFRKCGQFWPEIIGRGQFCVKKLYDKNAVLYDKNRNCMTKWPNCHTKNGQMARNSTYFYILIRARVYIKI